MIHLALLCLIAWQSGHPAGTFPPPATFAAEVRRGLTRGFRVQEDFAYIERKREVDISAFGKVTMGPVNTFEVVPLGPPGDVRKRLIEVDGRPLPPEELARRDAEYARDVRRTEERRRRERPWQREARLKQEEEERREFEAMLDDAVAVYEPAFVGRERVDGHPVWIVDVKPRPDVAVQTRQGEWMRHFEGRIWVSEADYQIVRLEMRAVRDVTVGWGVIGRVDEGSRVSYARQQVGGAWLPRELTYHGTGRTLLVRPFEVAATTTYSNYRRVRPAPPSRRGSGGSD